VSVAYVVLAHKEPQTLAELLDELAPSPTFVHIDRPALDAAYVSRSRAGDHPQVTVNPNARCLHWGGFSILQAMLETLQLALRDTSNSTEHIVFLSGQCFPLRPVKEFSYHLESTPTPVLCRAFDMAQHSEPSMGLQRLTQRHWLDGRVGHLRKSTARAIGGTARRAMLEATRRSAVRVPPLVHACGSQWVALPRPLSLELINHYRRGGFDYLRNAYAPDEIAIPTYIYNSPWAKLTPTGALEKVTGRTVASYSNFHWLRSSMQGVVTDEDVHTARMSDQYFIRKVSISQESNPIPKIRGAW
jgi:hypothetical protein